MPEASFFLVFTERFERINIPYMVSGSVASMIYGEPRLTFDVDIIAALQRDDIPALIDIFPSEEFYCPPPEVLAVECARERRGHFNLIHHVSGFKADIYVSVNDPLHRWGLAHTRRMSVGKRSVIIAPPEYVIVRKLEYYREGRSEKHIRDIESMIRVLGPTLDREMLHQLLLEQDLDAEWRRISPDML